MSSITVPQYKWARTLKAICDNRCVICGSTEKLEAHHIIPSSLRPDLANDLNNGLCLCHTCHWLYHNGNYGNNPKIDHNYIRPVDLDRFKMVKDFKEHCALIILTADQKKMIEDAAAKNGETVNDMIVRLTEEDLSIRHNDEKEP